MSKYLSYFPKVEYGDYIVRNITRRIKIKERLNSKPYVYMPYTVVNNDRPEDVAFYYYGSVEMTWLIYAANDIIDPYTDWPKTEADFHSYLIKKYGEASGELGFGVIAWTQRTDISDNILYYKNELGDRISNDTYDLNTGSDPVDPSFIAGNWTPHRIYDKEFEDNERKRNINLINKDYAKQIIAEFRGLVNE